MKAVCGALLSCGALLALAVSQAGAQKSGREIYAELGKAPEKARERTNPLENDKEAIAAGRLLFEDHCAECHGDKAEGGSGRKRGPSLRAAEVQNAKPGAIFWVLTNGVVRKGMPVWSRLPEPQRWQLVKYLKSLGVEDGAQPGPAQPRKP